MHLHLHTIYSARDSLIKIPDLITKIKENGHTFCAITDHHNLCGVPEFFFTCKDNNIKPIIGCELNVKTTDGEYGHLIVLAKNLNGYKSLVQLINKTTVKKKKIITIDDVMKLEDVIITTACVFGYTAKIYETYGLTNFKTTINNFKEIFKDDFYIEGVLENKIINNLLVNIAAEKNIKTIITADSHYLNINDSTYYKQLINYEGVDYLYYYRTDELIKKSENLLGYNCIDTINEINEKIDIYELPKYKPLIVNDYSTFENEVNKIISNEKDNNSRQRLKTELYVIKKCNLLWYFDILLEIINFLKENKFFYNIRGSANSSFILSKLNITYINPFDYNLMVERFINEDRLEPPDIDIDLPSQAREGVINFLSKKYIIYPIINNVFYHENSAIKRIGHKCGYDFKTVNKWTRNKKTPQNIINMANGIVGAIQTYSIHAAGICIADDNMPLNIINGVKTSSYDKRWLEKLNYLKIDLLYSKTLDIIQSFYNKIGGKIYNIIKNLNDDKTYSSIGDGTLIFQFEKTYSSVIREYPHLKIKNFIDIINLTALLRPGAKQFLDVYAKRKRDGYKQQVFHETYGLPIFQEQIIQYLLMNGFTYKEADSFRKAIGKKNVELMKKYKDKFYEEFGKKYTKEKIDILYQKFINFCDYSFNKSHAVSYSLITYLTAFLKAHYKNDMICEYINNHMNNTEKIKRVCKKYKNIIMPNIFLSDVEKTTVYDNKIILPLTLIPNIKKQTLIKIAKKAPSNYHDVFKLNLSKSEVDNLLLYGALGKITKNELIEKGLGQLYTGIIKDEKYYINPIFGTVERG